MPIWYIKLLLCDVSNWFFSLECKCNIVNRYVLNLNEKVFWKVRRKYLQLPTIYYDFWNNLLYTTFDWVKNISPPHIGCFERTYYSLSGVILNLWFLLQSWLLRSPFLPTFWVIFPKFLNVFQMQHSFNFNFVYFSVFSGWTL